MTDPRILLRGASVLVGEDQAPRLADLIVAGHRIADVGDPHSFDDEQVDDAVDLDGKYVLPGFIDGHCHLELTVASLDNHLAVHTPPYRSLGDIYAFLERARHDKPDGWIIARSSFGLQRKVVDGRLPHKDELDRVSPGQPLVVLAGLHVACLNSAAIHALGLDDPSRLPGWISVDTDANGMTGVFTEVWDRLPTASAEDVVASLRAHSIPLFSRAGTTSLSTIPTSSEDVRALHRLARSGELPFRVRFYVHVPRTATLDDVISWGPESGFGDDRLRFGGVKIFVDGEGADAYGVERDDSKWELAQLTEFIRKADAAGIQVMMHAVTPEAVRMACNSVIGARQDATRPSRVRHRIEHGADYMDVADAGLAARASVGLVATPHFAMSAETHRPYFQPLRSLIDAGHRIIGASDSTGTVPEGVAPLNNISAAAARLTPDGRPSPHRTSILEGVRMFTSWAARGVSEENEKGTIAPGRLADLVVLDADPFSVRPEEVASITVDRTIVGGRAVTFSHRDRLGH
ncbi:amidohydrolase family protein [Microtetraspora sp. NBRC 16547]|uniref:amidohydrolase n=1 Tax=Microtetraspora sp. NBRC 16547 TaxID=3030993 RepID=UPI0024A06D9C|nr:amidohydrolase family protein [Microtetraspora sp. NBRC 16547]GLW99341.1 amidohydrolase [Microtetraspora sp. NBRC 16547]